MFVDGEYLTTEVDAGHPAVEGEEVEDGRLGQIAGPHLQSLQVAVHLSVDVRQAVTAGETLQRNSRALTWDVTGVTAGETLQWNSRMLTRDVTGGYCERNSACIDM